MLFRGYLGWSLKHVAQNYLFISISFYLFIRILCAKMSRVNKALLFLLEVCAALRNESSLLTFSIGCYNRSLLFLGGESQNFLCKYVIFLVTLGLKILRLLWLKVLFKADIIKG